MTITMPQGLQDLASVVVGADFPEADEDALRRLGEAWAACGTEVGEVLGDTEAAIKDVLSTMQGQTADAFKKFGESITTAEDAETPTLKALQELCETLGGACDDVALEAEYTKCSIIAALAILFAQIALMIAMAWCTFGASTAAIPAAQAATQAATRTLIEVLKQALLKIAQEIGKQLAIQISLNLSANLLVDFGIQTGQAFAGDREEWDGSKTGAAALTGLAGGIAAGVTGGALGGVTRGLTDKLGNKLGDKFGDTVGGKTQWGGAILGGAGIGAAGGVAGGAMASGFQGEKPDEQGLGAGAIGGAAGGAGGAGGKYHTDLDNYTSSGSKWEEWDGAPPKDTDVTDLIGPPKSNWEEWDGAPPKDTDVTDLVGPKSNWEEWDGAPPKDTDVTDLVGPRDESTNPDGGNQVPPNDRTHVDPPDNNVRNMIPGGGEIPLPGAIPQEEEYELKDS